MLTTLELSVDLNAKLRHKHFQFFRYDVVIIGSVTILMLFVDV